MDETRKSSQILTYMWMIEMISELEYIIAWKGGLKKWGEKEKTKKSL